ncbi:MAG: lipid-A-disaccharide synthase [Phycisphaeraceae bacterium]|nr:MAG: lipid-A-disaccharide synthase [Phycisphaeraceae bacterium]
MPDGPVILFTGFEPSGDDHASAVIAELRRRHPDLKMFAWGGPKMAAAGAEVVEETGQNAVMGLPGLGKILEHRRINQRVAAWLNAHPTTVHVPVDSPAANFPICAMAKARGAKVVHLVAPQVWAWGKWRVHKLRRLTDFVCCLLPFEEDYFKQRNVPAKFVGHPLFDTRPDEQALAAQAESFPQSGRRVALMPGSRPSEIEKNFPLLIEAFRRLKKDYPDLSGVVAGTRPELEEQFRGLAERTPSAPGCEKGWPEGLAFTSRQTDAVIHWCELALVVSGTVTLQIAKQARPMVIVYKSSRLMYWLLARWLLSTPFFSLPNLVAGERIVAELIPHFGGPEPLVDEAVALLERPELCERQRTRLREIGRMFEGRSAAVGAADAIERVAGLATRAEAAELIPAVG